jgi:hypothetical protein
LLIAKHIATGLVTHQGAIGARCPSIEHLEDRVEPSGRESHGIVGEQNVAPSRDRQTSVSGCDRAELSLDRHDVNALISQPTNVVGGCIVHYHDLWDDA